MKNILSTLLVLLLSLTINAQDTLHISDFEILNHTSWKGTLTYKDYQSGKETTIDVTMQTKIKGEKIISNMQYTYEPNKNNKSSVKIKKNGTYFGNEKVISNSLENGKQIFVTTYNGRDNGKKATIYITRTMSKTTLKVVKEVQFKNTKIRFVRNTYSFTKL